MILFFMLTARELEGDIGLLISPEEASLISTYGSFFIHYPRFTYICIGGFPYCPLMLSHFVDVWLVLSEVCRQIGQVKESAGTKDQSLSQLELDITIVYLLRMLKKY